MPHNVLSDFINGDLSFEDAYKKYPSGYVLEVNKVDEEALDQDDNVTILTCADNNDVLTRWSVRK